MAELELRGVLGSPYLRATLMACEEKGVPYDLVTMSLGEAKAPEHLELHPFGRIPVLRHGDFKLYETQAIIRYIDALHPVPPLQPKDPQTAARMNQMIGIIDWYFFRMVTATIGFQRIIAPMMGRPTDEAIVATAVPDARQCMGELERQLGAKSYLSADVLTIADLMLAPQLEYIAMTPEGAEILRGTRLQEWLTRMIARDSMQRTAPERLRRAA